MATTERIFDRHGLIGSGRTAGDIFCARFERHISDRVGEAYANRLLASLGGIKEARYLLDLSELTSIDLLARSTLVRKVLANRQRFSRIVALTGTGVAGSAFAQALGHVERLVSAEEFYTRLADLQHAVHRSSSGTRPTIHRRG